jgi:DnaK suppressor protein
MLPGDVKPKDVEFFKALLLKRQVELRAEGDVELVPENAGDDTARKVDEDAAPLAEMNQVIASKRNLERTRQLEAIGEALELIADDPDEYGNCEDCSEPIKRRRLELMPWSTLCIRCAERHEQSDIPGGRRRHLTDYK